MSELNNKFTIQSYIDENRNNIDEALVSLRLMKQVDDYLDLNNISNRDLALSLDYSESYISQLMSGVKKINTSFINKFEKKYNLTIDFKIRSKDDTLLLSKVNERVFFEIKININTMFIRSSASSFSLNKTSNAMFEIENAEEAKYVNF